MYFSFRKHDNWGLIIAFYLIAKRLLGDFLITYK